MNLTKVVILKNVCTTNHIHSRPCESKLRYHLYTESRNVRFLSHLIYNNKLRGLKNILLKPSSLHWRVEKWSCSNRKMSVQKMQFKSSDYTPLTFSMKTVRKSFIVSFLNHIIPFNKQNVQIFQNM